jgi:hypothetical protein
MVEVDDKEKIEDTGVEGPENTEGLEDLSQVNGEAILSNQLDQSKKYDRARRASRGQKKYVMVQKVFNMICGLRSLC